MQGYRDVPRLELHIFQSGTMWSIAPKQQGDSDMLKLAGGEKKLRTVFQIIYTARVDSSDPENGLKFEGNKKAPKSNK